MSDRDITLYILDIFIAIDKIKRYSTHFHNPADFLHSELEWDASLRELQIIGDAVNILLKYKLIDEAYRRIVDFRNQITHAYFGIDEEIVWEVITKKITTLNDDLHVILKNKQIDLTNAINAAIKENSYNPKVSEFLIRLHASYANHS